MYLSVELDVAVFKQMCGKKSYFRKKERRELVQRRWTLGELSNSRRSECLERGSVRCCVLPWQWAELRAVKFLSIRACIFALRRGNTSETLKSFPDNLSKGWGCESTSAMVVIGLRMVCRHRGIDYWRNISSSSVLHEYGNTCVLPYNRRSVAIYAHSCRKSSEFVDAGNSNHGAYHPRSRRDGSYYPVYRRFCDGPAATD